MFDERFWLGIAFITFIAILIKLTKPFVLKLLDDKSKLIADDILSAKENKEQALKLLENAQKKHQESISFASKLIEESMQEAKKIIETAQQIAQIEIDKKLEATINRIAISRELAIREMKVKIINEAIDAIKLSIQNQKSNNPDSIKRAIDNINKVVH